MIKSNVKPSSGYLQENRERIGECIRKIREKRGYSQDELSKIMEIDRSTISKIENGKFAASIDYIVKFGWHLDFDIDLKEKNNETEV